MAGLLDLYFGSANQKPTSKLTCEEGSFNKEMKLLQDSQIKQIGNAHFAGIKKTDPKTKCTSVNYEGTETVHYYLGSIDRTFSVESQLSMEEPLVFLKKESRFRSNVYSIEIFGKFSPCKSQRPKRYNAVFGMLYGIILLMNVHNSFPFDYNNWPKYITGSDISEDVNDIFHQLKGDTNNRFLYMTGKREPYFEVRSTKTKTYSFTVPQVLSVPNRSRSGTIDMDLQTTFFNKLQGRSVTVNGNSNCRNFLIGHWFSTILTKSTHNAALKKEITTLMNILIDVPFTFSDVIFINIKKIFFFSI